MKKKSKIIGDENMIRKEFENGLRQQRSIGVAQGAYAMCKVIVNKADDDSISIEERLSWIRSFCEKLIASATKKLEEAKPNNESTDH